MNAGRPQNQPHELARISPQWILFILILAVTLPVTGCKSRQLIWQAERKAQIGGEFIRLYDDGQAEYGFGVVTEKLKAKGAYRHAQDTLWLLDPSFRNHFEKGYLVVIEGMVIMETGFHFQVVQNGPTPETSK